MALAEQLRHRAYSACDACEHHSDDGACTGPEDCVPFALMALADDVEAGIPATLRTEWPRPLRRHLPRTKAVIAG